jgi:hypothetical protein
LITPIFAADSAATTAPRSGEIPEVVVSGKLSEIRKAIIEVEDRFHERYNALNKDHNFDIQCRNEAQTGTLLRRRACEPKFATAARQRDTDNLIRMTGAGGVYIAWADAEIAARMPDLKKNMSQLVKSDRELQRLLSERYQLQKRFMEVCRRQFKGTQCVMEGG